MGLLGKLKNKVDKQQRTDLLSIEKTNVIDGIAYDEKIFKLFLLLTDSADWHDEYNHLMLLQEKINNYFDYIEGKQYLETHPNAKVEEVEIQIKFLFKETDNCKKFLEIVKKTVNELSIRTTVNIESGTKDTY
ncbi:MAG: hypothetical protein IKU09_01570 [Firmicutes bacterium]|nr:hypothetical protein [Bacillota bacterium]